jgi:hypothetical protein
VVVAVAVVVVVGGSSGGAGGDIICEGYGKKNECALNFFYV